MPKKLMKEEMLTPNLDQGKGVQNLQTFEDVIYESYGGLSIRPCWLKLLLNNLTTI